MKRNYFLLCFAFLFGASMQFFAQVDPGTSNLKHCWTFDNGSLVDDVAGVAGVIVGNGTVANNAFVSTNAYVELPASEIGINAYPEITTEVWCTSQEGANSGWSMLTYFGETLNGNGANCTFLSIARGDNVSMASLEAPAWTGVTGAEYDDGKLHHFAYTVTATDITLFIDGLQIATAVLGEGNAIANISNSLAYIGRGGWSADPNWVGSFHKVSLYDKALTADEILYLFQQGAEESAVITTTATNFALDDNYPAAVFKVTASNLSAPISISTPAGISITNINGQPQTSLPADATDLQVVIMWNMESPLEGNVVLSSGSSVIEIPVMTVSDVNCFVPMYDDIQNILIDVMGMNRMSDFGGWGTREVVNVINNSENVYCGANSIKIGNGTTTGSGSLDILGGISAILLPNTTYKGRIMIKTIGGTFQLGVDAGPNVEFKIDTEGEWKPLDFMFTTGVTVGANMYINNWACTGLEAYVDNYELYIAPDPILKTSVATQAFDPEFKEAIFSVVSSNLGDNIVITAPAGIVVSPTELPAENAGELVTISWDGTTAVDGTIALTSGENIVNILVKTLTTSNNTCFTPLYTDKVSLNADIFMNNPANFGGWGGNSFVDILSNPDSLYCGSHSARILGQGSVDVVLTDKISPATTYKTKLMLRTFGGKFQVGAYGIDDVNRADVTDSIDTEGEWMPFEFEFTTAEVMTAAQGLFVNNYQRSGMLCYVDNWEIYEMSPNAVKMVRSQFAKVYIQNGYLVAEFNLEAASNVKFDVFNLQGALVSTQIKMLNAGTNREVISESLQKGMYLVRISQNGIASYAKVIK
ncbi:MAG: T9SS type A sorting domain-containing protein [Paludibacteraceae bacterium]|nr:T9SS type A sorting domain-containing protein [Paludibacteraceae bacterium]